MRQPRIKNPSDNDAKSRLEEFDEWYNSKAIDVFLPDCVAVE